MACFSLGFVEQLLIWLVVVGAVIALIKLVLPLVLGGLGVAANVVVQALTIIMWAVVAIFIIVFVFELAACLLGLAPRIR